MRLMTCSAADAGGRNNFGALPSSARRVRDPKLFYRRWIRIRTTQGEVFRSCQYHLMENPRYKWSGTMYGLSLLAGQLKDGFLLLKSDLVFEQKAISALLEERSPFSALLAAPSDHGDETFVELDGEGDIFRISKDLHQMNRLQER